MAYFNKGDAQVDPKNPFKFDIDEDGESSISRQQKQKEKEIQSQMINVGKHCTWKYCGILDILPCSCDYCEEVYCKAHVHPDEHDCQHYIADLSESPLCSVCNEYIKIPATVKTRNDYNDIVKEHKESQCKLHTFKQTAAQKAEIKASLLCNAEFCDNHKTTGQRLSTLICKGCKLQVCLRHRFPHDHKCNNLAIEEEKTRRMQERKENERQELLNKAYNGATGRLGGDVATNAKANCKNPYLQKVLGSKQTTTPDTSQQQQTEQTITNPKEQQQQQQQNFIPADCVMIPTRGTLITHESVNILNVKTSIILAKTKTKIPSAANLAIDIPNIDDRVYIVVYFPQTALPTTATTSTIIPFSTQPTLSQFNTIQLAPNDNNTNNPSTTTTNQTPKLITATAFLPQCGPVTILNQQKNKILQQPLYICVSKQHTIKQIINQITAVLGLPDYDKYIKTTYGKALYTLSFLSQTNAILINSLPLSTILTQYEHDFDIETKYYQDNATAADNKASSRKNTMFLPLNLAFGWFIDEVPQ